jgi:hypothetical protein
VDPPISLSSPDLFRYPVIYITSAVDSVFELSSYQIQRFGEYLRQGGFAIVDNGLPMYDFSPVKASLLNILIKALGKDALFEPLIPDHPLFTCFFDFSDGNPSGLKHRAIPMRKNQYETPVMSDWVWGWETRIGFPYQVLRQLVIYPRLNELGKSMWGNLLHNQDVEMVHRSIRTAPESIWGVWVKDRMVAFYLDRGYGHFWKDGLEGYQFDPDLKPEFHFGINLLYFAFTQKGSIARQYVDWTAEAKAYQTAQKGQKAP